MVIAHLTRHWIARRHYPLASWLACIARSLRVLLFYRDHLRLLALDVYRQHLTQVHDDVFHHLSHRNYLAKGLSLRQRVRCVHTHYRFEDAVFDAAYKHAVYRDGGLVLWRQDTGGGQVEVRLAMAQRLNAEGDLTLSLLADGKCVHRLSFSWVDGRFAGTADRDVARIGPRIVPFIARNQGPRADAPDAVAAFKGAFPANSPVVTTPGFFCFAALQGIAAALGMDHVVAVKSAWHCAYLPSDEKHFANAYDGFWESLGGVPMAGRGWRIALPLHVKPLADIPSKHRKRAAVRREQWRVIEESAAAAMRRHMVQSAKALRPEPAAQPA
jgi:uncharacterized protein VirK/YbjX